MKPKLKAEELVNHFNPYVGYKYNAAKQCALIAVDEIIKAIKTIEADYHEGYMDGDIREWQSVKIEIENL